jgi:hypothetical protein
MSDSDDREMGIELGEIDDAIEAHEYPVSTAELIEAYGDREIDLPKGSTTVGETLEPLGDETYESAEEVRESLLNTVGSEAVGREDYSDRGPATDETEGESDSVTL